MVEARDDRRSSRLRGARIPTIALAILLASCGSGDLPQQDGAVTFDARESWTLSAEPVFRIPGTEIDGDSIFFAVTMPGTFTREGDIVVAITQGEYQVVVLDSLGTGIDVFGRTGRGPREFQRLTHVSANGDTVAAWDWINGRVSLFAGREHVEQFSLPLRRSQMFVGLLQDGTAVATPRSYMVGRVPTVPEDSVSAGDRRPYAFIDRSGDDVATRLGPPDDGSPVLELQPTRADVPPGGSHLGSGCLPETFHATQGNEVVVASTRDGILHGLDRQGRLRTLFRTEYRGRVRQDFVDRVERAIEWQEERGPVTGASKDTAWQRVGEVGDPLPAAWSAMVTDVRGGVWLERAECPASGLDPAPTTWEVLDEEWQLRATVEVPGEARVLSVHGDKVLAAITPYGAIPRLALYRVER